jgi:hypothetical protein
MKELFFAMVELPDPPARRALLDRECAGDSDLRRRLDALLPAHDCPDPALGRPLAAPGEAVGTVVASRDKLLVPIGEGGMGRWGSRTNWNPSATGSR